MLCGHILTRVSCARLRSFFRGIVEVWIDGLFAFHPAKVKQDCDPCQQNSGTVRGRSDLSRCWLQMTRLVSGSGKARSSVQGVLERTTYCRTGPVTLVADMALA